jgi:trans-AT polyketide synthase/acyltransferase/oxidoreductase domain-containing protein
MDPAQRHAADVAHHLMQATAFHCRLTQLRSSGVTIPSACAYYRLLTPRQPIGTAPG